MQNITGNFATEQGVREGRDFPSLPPGDTGREMLLCRPLDYRHGPPGAPSTQKGPRALTVPDCASPCAWESPGGGEQRGRALQGAALHQLLWLFLHLAPQASFQPESQTAIPLPASSATTKKRRASDSESSVCRTRWQTAGENGLSPRSRAASGRGAGGSCCLSGPGSGLGSVPA